MSLRNELWSAIFNQFSAMIAYCHFSSIFQNAVSNICQALPNPFRTKSNPLGINDLQAHWARAKRQQHLPNELALYLKVKQYLSFICGKIRYVTCLTPKLRGAGAPNTAQKSMPAEYQRFNKEFFFKQRIKALGKSLSLPALLLRSAVSTNNLQAFYPIDLFQV